MKTFIITDYISTNKQIKLKRPILKNKNTRVKLDLNLSKRSRLLF